MSSEKFESLEDDFITTRNEINRKIETLLPKVTGEIRKNTLREIQRELEDAEIILREIEDEVRLAPNPYNFHMNSRMKQYNQELGLMKKRVSLMDNASYAENRQDLFATGMSSNTPSATTSTYREKVLHTRKVVERTSESVFRAQQVAAETEQVGIAVVDELGTQRDTLVRTKERLVDTDSNLTRSRKILRSMYRKVITNKLILIAAIVLELVILGIVVYYKFFRK